MPRKQQTGTIAIEYAYDQINSAIVAGFYLEAIAIEDAILRERLFHRGKEAGMRSGRKSATLRTIIHHWRGMPPEQLTPNCLEFLDRVSAFINQHETCLEMVAQHSSAPVFDTAAFNKLAQCAAVEGKELVLKVLGRSDLNRKL